MGQGMECRKIKNELHAVSRQLVDAVRQKYGASNDSQERERVKEGLIGVDLNSDSSSKEDPPPTHQKMVRRMINDWCWLRPRPPSLWSLKMSANGGWCLACFNLLEVHHQQDHVCSLDRINGLLLQHARCLG